MIDKIECFVKRMFFIFWNILLPLNYRSLSILGLFFYVQIYLRNMICEALFTLGVNQFSYENENKKREHIFAPKFAGALHLGYAF